jgi:hypothetical protein
VRGLSKEFKFLLSGFELQRQIQSFMLLMVVWEDHSQAELVILVYIFAHQLISVPFGENMQGKDLILCLMHS